MVKANPHLVLDTTGYGLLMPCLTDPDYATAVIERHRSGTLKFLPGHLCVFRNGKQIGGPLLLPDPELVKALSETFPGKGGDGLEA